MGTYTLTRYPRVIALHSGSTVQIRPMVPTDVDALLAYFTHLSEQDRFFLKEDVTSRSVVEGWATSLDYNRALPLLALDGERIVADAVLLRRRGNARSHVGEIRTTVDPEYRGQGLGNGILRELIEIAYDGELEFVLFELVSETEDQAIQAVSTLGAFETGRIEEAAVDLSGRHHDLVFFKLPLGKYWEWSRF
jgi:L-amino acid N-acyltransferase YncA